MDALDRLAAMAKGREALNRGDFYEAHEFWEDVWNDIDEPERIWVQGLIQFATGCHKLMQGHSRPTEMLLTKAVAKIADAPLVLDGVDIAAARAAGLRLLEGLARNELPDPRDVRV